MKHLALTLAAILLSGCASMTTKERAQAAIGADAATTAIGIGALGLVEANPLGLAAIPLSLVAVEYCETLPEVERVSCLHTVESSRWAFATWNLCLAALGPACAIPAAIVGWKVWSDGAAEREFSELCATHKALAGNPSLRCVYAANH